MKMSIVLVVLLILVGVAGWDQDVDLSLLEKTSLTDPAQSIWAQSNVGRGHWLHDLWVSDQTTNRNDPLRNLYDSAVYAGFVFGQASIMAYARWIDIPGDVSGRQVVIVVGKYLDAHPEKLNLRAEELIYRALDAVWPGKVTAPFR